MTLKTYLYYVMYEVLQWYVERHPTVRLLWWYPLALKELAPEWVTVKVKQTMDDVDRQAAALFTEESGVPDPVFTEKPSQVDGLPEMRLSAPWSITTEKSEGST